jgi:N-acetylglucosaminyldiphosphoundecaprenol N-acetyl-beta-D-mannosaminyltransferase
MVSLMNRVTSILGFNVSTESIRTIVKEALNQESCMVINTINPHSYVEQKNNSDFTNALLNSDVLLPDGSGIVFAARFLSHIELTKTAGFDLFQETITQLNNRSGKVFFLGSTDMVLDLIESKLALQYTNVTVNTLSPPFTSKFNEHEITNIVNAINLVKPDVVFVGLTAPKQEILIQLLRNRIDVKFLSGIGAVFDFYAGNIKRPSSFWIKLHLEWLIRLIGEPKRLWRRNFISTPIFMMDLIKAKFKVNNGN